MDFAKLLEKLLQIEMAAAKGDFSVIHALTIEAEELAIDLEREMIDRLEKQRDPGLAA